MKRFLTCIVALMLAVALIPIPAQAEVSPPSNVIGMLVRSLENEDFPSNANLSAKAMRAELEQLTEYAAAGGYNSIFFEARPEGDALYSSSEFPRSRFLVKKQGDFTFFDPLKEMIKAASKNGLTVYAVVDPYYLGTDQSLLDSSNPAVKNKDLLLDTGNGLYLDPDNDDTVRINANDLGRMAKKYAIGGIILRGLQFSDEAVERSAILTQNVSAAINGRTTLGVMLDDGSLDELSPIVEQADLVLPIIRQEVGLGEDSYQNRLADWQKLAGTKLIPVIDAVQKGVQLPLSAEQLSAQAFVSEQAGISSRVVGNYRALAANTDFAGDLLASMTMASSTSMTKIDYRPASTLTVTRPTETISTTTSSYFIMGTSDPSSTLTIDWKEVDRKTEDGVFGVLVNLAMGTNTFTLRQGNSAETVTIRRTDGVVAPSPISDIRSMYPVSSAVVKNGEKLAVRCIAPSGSGVTATIGGVTATLQQSDSAQTGIPATFTGSITLSGAASGSVKSQGPITYTLNGSQSFYSAGNVYLAGDGARPMLRVTEQSASVFPDSSVKEGDYQSVYKAGTQEEITGQMGEYYELASGFYIKKATVEILESEKPDLPEIKRISAQSEGRVERFVLEGAAGLPYSFEDGEGETRVTFYGELTLPKEIDTTSTLFSSIEWVQNSGSITAILHYSDPKQVWAVDVLNTDADTILYARRAPTLSDKVGRPLTGISVVLDPGHGGADSGALSVLGLDGPTERELNLADALALKLRLEQLGATVVLTRTTNDETLSAYDRMELAQEILPDFFLSLHHNSVAESVDGYIQSGVESYYYDPFAKSFGEAVVRHISNANYARGFRFSDWSYYTVTRMRYTPSVLCELGYVPNPVEYRNVCDTTEIYKTANAISAAMLEVISAAT